MFQEKVVNTKFVDYMISFSTDEDRMSYPIVCPVYEEIYTISDGEISTAGSRFVAGKPIIINDFSLMKKYPTLRLAWNIFKEVIPMIMDVVRKEREDDSSQSI